MDQLSPSARTERMRRIKSQDTRPEIAFRQGVWRRGLRFRLGDRRLPGKPDLIFPRHRLAVFIDGDFWHGHQWRKRRLTQLDDQFAGAKNGAYWRAKIRRNVERDFRVTSAILAENWRVLRFWESDLTRDLEGCIDMTVSAVTNSAKRASSELPSLSTSVAGRTASHQTVAHRTVAEFFAGIGLVRLALDNCGWQTLFANDYDANKARMYAQNFGDADFSNADIHTLPAADIPRCALFTASFPCNDLSVAGSMNGIHGKNSSAFWGFIRIVRELEEARPPLILLENVAGFLSANGGRDFEAALLALNELGYTVDAFMLNAESFAPQSRVRLFVVAKLQSGTGTGAGEAVAVSDLRPAALTSFINAHPKIRWDIRTLPSPPKRAVDLKDIVEDLPDDAPEWWNTERAEYFMNQLSDRHREVAVRMIAARQVTYATAFRRVRKGRSMAELRTDGVAGCLRTPRGGSGRQILFKAGHGRYQVRLMTPRECARLQGAPETFKIEVPANQALFGFGDAVCVPVIEWIAEHYLNPVAAEMLRGKLLT